MIHLLAWVADIVTESNVEICWSHVARFCFIKTIHTEKKIIIQNLTEIRKEKIAHKNSLSFVNWANQLRFNNF